MRPFLAAVLLLGCSASHAFTIDARALARFDVSYAKCEKQIPQMRGRRDQAYLGLWRQKADEANRAALSAARTKTEYRDERVRALRQPAGGASAASPLEQQCQALWSETQRSNAPRR